MNERYGQTITWGPLTAPALFTGAIMSYSYRDQVTKQNEDDGGGNILAMVLHSRKAALAFEAKVTSGTDDFLNLSAGAKIAVTGIAAGVVLASRVVETWRLMQPKRASVQATHYPDMVDAAGASAGSNLSAVTPDQAALGLLFPGSALIYSTFGFTHAAGIVHGLTLTQTLQIQDDEPSPDGKLLGAQAFAYERMISLDLLATAAAPAVKSTLAVVGAPDHASGYIVTGVDTMFEDKRGKMYRVEAAWNEALEVEE